MSRVDDDRDAARLAERLIQERKLAEAKTKKRQEGESVFSKLVQQGQAEKATQTHQPQGLARAVLARATQSGLTQGKTFDERVAQKQAGESERANQGGKSQTESTAGREGTSSASQQASANASSAEARAESRHVESREDRRSTETRDGDLSKASASAGRASSEKGELKAESDSGGSKGGGGGSKDGKKEGGGEVAAGFRFNPALMAPVPVAKPKPSAAGSERLRAMASEIAQKIVERVRIGTNAAGNAEFQLDLRGDVLNGLSIKVSARNGKISAVFSGSDRQVLKMLEEQGEGLRSALGGRGLTLEQLKFEAKA
ncbi:flagellar hook-length control protein FliK [Myxococcaceae bacterium JPH2]|nr:flagellar hook-length control protein FliK [Myxococcaceae bacterium JPH2]